MESPTKTRSTGDQNEQPRRKKLCRFKLPVTFIHLCILTAKRLNFESTFSEDVDEALLFVERSESIEELGEQ